MIILLIGSKTMDIPDILCLSSENHNSNFKSREFTQKGGTVILCIDVFKEYISSFSLLAFTEVHKQGTMFV